MRSPSLPERAASLAALLALALPSPGVAQGGNGEGLGDAPSPTRQIDQDSGNAQEGALFLLLPLGAQGVAMGRAMTALRTPEAAFWNPAGLNELQKSQILFYQGDHLAGEAFALSVLFARPAMGTLGFSYQLLDVGTQDLTDDFGNVLGEVSVRNHL
ncbi:MAG TPA: hypothetical protein VLL48_03190, partial [Longimicrobiales bacterium]|nr:hypothetical protein [Longimicrobiales bacterium]